MNYVDISLGINRVNCCIPFFPYVLLEFYSICDNIMYACALLC